MQKVKHTKAGKYERENNGDNKNSEVEAIPSINFIFKGSEERDKLFGTEHARPRETDGKVRRKR